MGGTRLEFHQQVYGRWFYIFISIDISTTIIGAYVLNCYFLEVVCRMLLFHAFYVKLINWIWNTSVWRVKQKRKFYSPAIKIHIENNFVLARTLIYCVVIRDLLYHGNRIFEFTGGGFVFYYWISVVRLIGRGVHPRTI